MMSRVKRTALPALALAGLLTVSGCAGNGMQEGVVVDGEAYSVEDVQEAAQQFAELSGQQVAPQAIASVAGSVPVLDDYFAGTSFAADEGQLRSQLATAGLEGEPNELTLDVARYQYYASVLNDPMAQQDPALAPVMEKMQGFQADVAAQDVQVNPRFGAWDPAAGQVVAQVPAWIQQTPAS